MAEYQGPSSEEIKQVDVHTAKGLFEVGYRYLDVRTEEEFETGHVDGALNIPYMFEAEEGRVKNPDFVPQVSEKLKKDDRFIVACYAGARGHKATTELHQEGFEDVANIEGGYSAWLDAGFAGENAQKVASKFHP